MRTPKSRHTETSPPPCQSHQPQKHCSSAPPPLGRAFARRLHQQREQRRQEDRRRSAANAADDKPGKTVTIGFAGPQADHGWLNAINEQGQERAKEYKDVTLEITEGSNDTAQQIGQIETLINKKVDVLVILPADGKALTQVGLKAMRAGIPVVNLDRIFDSPQAYRCWIGGDNYGMGLNAGHYIGEQLKGKKNAKVIELAGHRQPGADQAAHQGLRRRAEELPEHQEGRPPGRRVHGGVGPGEDGPTAPGAVEVRRAVEPRRRPGRGRRARHRAGRARRLPDGRRRGRHAAMDAIKPDNGVLKATVLYPPTMAASAIDLARALGQGKGVGGLAEFEIPASLTLYSAVVTKDNVDQYLPTGFK